MRWTLRRLRKGAGNFEKNAAASAVVRGPVVDAISLSIGINAEMVVVRCKENSVLRACVGARHSGNDVRRIVFAHAAFAEADNFIISNFKDATKGNIKIGNATVPVEVVDCETLVAQPARAKDERARTDATDRRMGRPP